jgi:hypothetical protein
MKNRLEALLTLLGLAALGLSINIAKAYAVPKCTASCPPGYTQTSSSCPVVVQCSTATCSGFIVCRGSAGTNIHVACGCQ